MDPCTDYMLDIDEPAQGIMLHLHHLITQFPEVTGKIRYRIPFYYRKSWICYLNPLPRGQVELAFTRANELSNEQGLLDFRGRKQVAGIVFSAVEEIPEETLMEVLSEAILLDEEVPYKSKRSK